MSLTDIVHVENSRTEVITLRRGSTPKNNQKCDRKNRPKSMNVALSHLSMHEIRQVAEFDIGFMRFCDSLYIVLCLDTPNSISRLLQSTSNFARARSWNHNNSIINLHQRITRSFFCSFLYHIEIMKYVYFFPSFIPIQMYK